VNSAVLALGPALTLGPAWLDAQKMLDAFGAWALWGAAAVVFAECGLMLGFFLPGDSLLFTVGLLVGSGTIKQPLWVACIVLTVAAFAGNAVGYEIGRASGPRLFSRPDSRLFKREYVDKTVAFFDKYGPRAIVLARFVPIVRTFITVIAGVGQMDRRRYLTYSGIGGLLWACGVTVLGQLLGKITFVAKNIELILIAIVVVSVLPIGVEWLRHRRSGGIPSSTGTAGSTSEGTAAAPGTSSDGATTRPADGQVTHAEWTASLPVVNPTPEASPDRSAADQQPRVRRARHATDVGGPWTAPRGISKIQQDPTDG
jgi:membrane-associated protein